MKMPKPIRSESTKPHGRVWCDSFEIHFSSTDDETTAASFRWVDIAKVEAFKRDLFTIDLVCITIRRSDGMVLEVDEETEGWTELINEFPKQLPGCLAPNFWLSDGTFPAFIENRTELFSIQPPPDDQGGAQC